MSTFNHWDRIEESANAIDPGRTLNLSVVTNDLCRALLDLRDEIEAARGLAAAALESHNPEQENNA